MQNNILSFLAGVSITAGVAWFLQPPRFEVRPMGNFGCMVRIPVRGEIQLLTPGPACQRLFDKVMSKPVTLGEVDEILRRAAPEGLRQAPK